MLYNMKKTGVRKDSLPDLDLNQDEIDVMRDQFNNLDRQKTGFINSIDLKTLFQGVNEFPNDHKLQLLTTWTEEKAGSKKFDFNIVLRAWSYLKDLKLKDEEDEVDYDILNTFVAMGGDTDGGGFVRKQKLVEIIKVQFGLTIDIEKMFDDAGIIVDDELRYEDFISLMESGGSNRPSRNCSIFSLASVT